MAITVKLSDIIQALEEASDSVTHYLDKRTGQIEMVTDDMSREIEREDDDLEEVDLEDDDNQPDWLREATAKAHEILENEGEHFIQLPDHFDIHDYAIMEDFSRHYRDATISIALMDAIKGSGAFRRFNSLVHNLGIEKNWYQFRYDTYKQIAIDWLEQHEIPYTRDEEIEIDPKL